MNDKELLELAAKAAGIVGIDGVYPIARDSSGECYFWNPLTDDGDAFRLAIQLDMGIRVSPYPGAYQVASRDPARGGKCDAVAVTIRVSPEKAYLFREDFGEDRYAATCRAIVRAAAEIGRGME